MNVGKQCGAFTPKLGTSLHFRGSFLSDLYCVTAIVQPLLTLLESLLRSSHFLVRLDAPYFNGVFGGSSLTRCSLAEMTGKGQLLQSWLMLRLAST